jgi:hypothetical protein
LSAKKRKAVERTQILLKKPFCFTISTKFQNFFSDFYQHVDKSGKNLKNPLPRPFLKLVTNSKRWAGKPEEKKLLRTEKFPQ